MAKSSVEQVRDMLMTNWKTAYAEYNDKPAPPIHYEDGYFVIEHPDRPHTKHRQQMLMRMTDNLNKLIERRDSSEGNIRN